MCESACEICIRIISSWRMERKPLRSGAPQHFGPAGMREPGVRNDPAHPTAGLLTFAGLVTSARNFTTIGLLHRSSTLTCSFGALVRRISVSVQSQRKTIGLEQPKLTWTSRILAPLRNAVMGK